MPDICPAIPERHHLWQLPRQLLLFPRSSPSFIYVQEFTVTYPGILHVVPFHDLFHGNIMLYGYATKCVAGLDLVFDKLSVFAVLAILAVFPFVALLVILAVAAALAASSERYLFDISVPCIKLVSLSSVVVSLSVYFSIKYYI